MNYIVYISDSFYLVLYFIYTICKYSYIKLAIVRPL